MRRVITHYLAREMAVLGLAEAALSFAAIYAVVALAGSPGPSFGLEIPRDAAAAAGILTLVTGATGLAIGLYRAEVCFDRKQFAGTAALAVALAFAVLLMLSGDMDTFSTARAVFLAKALGAWLGILILIRLTYLAVRRTPVSRRVLLVGDHQHTKAFHARIAARGRRRFEPVVLNPEEISWDGLRAHRIWGIVVASTPEATAIRPLLDCKLRGMQMMSAAAFHENHLGRIDLDLLTANDLLMSHGFVTGHNTAALKRLLDIVLGVTILLLTLPLMAATALAIKCDSRGPVFYRQQRAGRFDKPFTLFKFRSMAVDAEAGGGPRWAQQRDPRVTRVGRFIRSTRIDELPQLANVLCGTMSLVGPRPERPHFVAQLAHVIPFYRQRAYVKPGLTGWAQINFPYGASVEDAREKLAYDLYYVKNRSLLLDAVVLVSTVRVVLSREGAR
jgi:exopolysaccharide biosynthesis polyprenyl glycosylphosphotransferase